MTSRTRVKESLNKKGRECDFENFQKIGRGGFASVYKCSHKIDGREYALKKIKIEDKDAEEKINKIYSEVKQLSNLDHPNIVRYYGCWCSTGVAQEGKQSCSISPEKSRCGDHSSSSFGLKELHSGDNSPVFDFFQQEEQGVASPEKSSRWRSGKREMFELEIDIDIDIFGDSEGKEEEANDEGDVVYSPYKKFQKLDTMVMSKVKEQKKEFFIQMELCDQTLKDYLKKRNELCHKRGLNKQESLIAFKLAKELIRALCYMRDKQILHRDIKPSNIFVNKHGVLKIGDFGLVKQCQVNAIDPSPLESPLKMNPAKMDCSTDDTFDIDEEEKKAPNGFSCFRYEMKEFDFADLPKASPKMRKYTSDMISNPGLFEDDLKQVNGAQGGHSEVAHETILSRFKRLNCKRRERSKSCYYVKEELTSNIGTRLYASPEQTDSNYYSYETDHFSAGLVLLEVFYPILTEMQRIQVLTKARKGQLPLDFEVKHPDLHLAITSLLHQDPWKRLDLPQISSLISKEEIQFRKKSYLTKHLLFKKEGENEFKEKYIMLKDSSVFVYGSLEKGKAECVFDLAKFNHFMMNSTIIAENDHVCGFSLTVKDANLSQELEEFYGCF